MTTYWSILEKVKGSALRLTKIDDDILDHLKRDFPDFDPAETIDEDVMKSKEGKERWRNFMMAYEKKVDDYNFGTMLRSNPKWEYGEKETIFGACLCDGRRSGLLTPTQCRACSFMPSRLRGKSFRLSHPDALLSQCWTNSRRNRLGLNDWIYERAQQQSSKPSA